MALKSKYFIKAGGEYLIGQKYKNLEKFKVSLNQELMYKLSSESNSEYIKTNFYSIIELKDGLVKTKKIDYLGKLKLVNSVKKNKINFTEAKVTNKYITQLLVEAKLNFEKYKKKSY